MNRFYPTMVFGLCAFVLLAGQAHADSQNTTNLGARIASTEEIVDYLAAAPAGKPIRTRGGLRLLETSAPEHRSRSISLQVNFAYNSHELTEFAIEQLKPVGSALVSEKLRSLAFDLEGHTDARGSDAYNFALSTRRAAAVKQFFMERFGVSTDRVSAIGRGEHQLLNRSEPFSGVNRRVSVTAYY
ncbi:MAG: OmpA family protein [Gammaproteobacteria bacterium]